MAGLRLATLTVLMALPVPGTLAAAPPGDALDPVAQVTAYNTAGVAINKALKHPDIERFGTWSFGPAEALGPVKRHPWVAGNDHRPDGGKFKLVTVDSVEADRVTATVRHERVAKGRTDRGFFRTTWQGGELLEAELTWGETVIGPATAFRDEAIARGLDFVGEPDPRYMPPAERAEAGLSLAAEDVPERPLKFQIIRHAIGGASAGDIDGDGWDDVLLTRGTDLRLFRNVGKGQFADETEARGLGDVRYANVSLFADFDGDGDVDLYLGRFFGPNALYRNDDGHFSPVTDGSGLAADDLTAVLAADDFNGDGHLDLYVGRFLDARDAIPTMIHYARNGAPNRLYLGQGDLTFRDVSDTSGADDRGFTLGIATADYDRDGDVDIYLANDFGRNVLLRNRGDGTFEDIAKEAGALAISAGMSAGFGDYDNDGLLDLYVSSIRSNQRWFSTDLNIRGYILRIVQTERREALQSLFLDLRKHLGDDWDQLGQVALSGNHLLKNRGDGTFENVSEAAGANPFGWYWSSGFYDFDNDGDEDILALNGWITGPKKHDL